LPFLSERFAARTKTNRFFSPKTRKKPSPFSRQRLVANLRLTAKVGGKAPMPHDLPTEGKKSFNDFYYNDLYEKGLVSDVGKSLWQTRHTTWQSTHMRVERRLEGRDQLLKLLERQAGEIQALHRAGLQVSEP
jgi:hypothetical protein